MNMHHQQVINDILPSTNYNFQKFFSILGYIHVHESSDDSTTAQSALHSSTVVLK